MGLFIALARDWRSIYRTWRMGWESALHICPGALPISYFLHYWNYLFQTNTDLILAVPLPNCNWWCWVDSDCKGYTKFIGSCIAFPNRGPWKRLFICNWKTLQKGVIWFCFPPKSLDSTQKADKLQFLVEHVICGWRKCITTIQINIFQLESNE